MLFRSQGIKSSLALDINRCALEYFYCVGKPLGMKRKIVKQVRWEKPCTDWLKLNTDGAYMGNTGLAGGGGLLRDKNGSWVGGFARKIGTTSSFTAELWALRDGLLLCRQRNAQAVAVEVDASAIVDAFNH